MSENMDMKIKFSVGAREVILSVMLVLMIYFAVNNPVYGWFNFLMSTAIVVGAGSMILLVYEASKGNLFEIPKAPTIDWKKGLRNVLLFCLVIALAIVGLFAMLVGYSYMMALVFLQDIMMYSFLAILSGIMLLTGAYIVFGKIFGNEEEEEPTEEE